MRTGPGRGIVRALTVTGALAAVAITAHSVYNARRARRVRRTESITGEKVSVLIPARDEAARIGPTLAAVIAQQGVDGLEVLVLDDGSTDGTADVVRSIAGDDKRVRVIDGGHGDLPPGWLGKPWACQRLAEAASGDVLLFLDADVTLAPRAVVSVVESLRGWDVDVISAFPRQTAVGAAERICQPMVGWAWLSLLPTRLAESQRCTLTTIGNGQVMVVDAAAYRTLGGHAVVADRIVEDIALMKAAKRARIRAVPAIASDVASCRMYGSAREVVDGYGKNIAVVLGSPLLTGTVLVLLSVAHLVPPIAAVVSRDRRTRAWGALGYASAVAGRVVVARHTGDRMWPDALAHPATVASFIALAAESFRRLRTGTAVWKGRVLTGSSRT